MSTLVVMVVLLSAPVALAVPRLESRREATQDPERIAPFGLMLDAGIPEGAGLSVAFRPTRLVRLHLGATHNGIRAGGRAGLTLLPMRGWLTPAISLDFGHAQPADERRLERRLSDLSQPPVPSLERVGYTYVSALLGLEVRMPSRITFFVRGGLSFMELNAPGLEGLEEPFRRAISPAEEKPWTMRLIRPTAKLGFLLSFG
ncbi:hypothetical protein LZ198_37915 [Myxococcus sp. K15C18031901]|uniref:hypothetical protein n=1 Tax=Myxococcus dinghuensis TaxID=2906761 RepID=UPI0020A7FBBB|nr:hypothetical protein [Myxococcus dinghuensis]MCP3104657.1 hypothetical protein [Myxococcus dinghuensis]